MLRRLIAAAVLCCCLLPASAGASYKDVLKDCVANGKLTKKYTQKEYRDALANMPTDAAEYYGCKDMIKRAQQRSASGRDDDAQSGGGGGGGNAPPTAPTPDEQARAQQEVIAAGRGDSQKVADIDVRPGALAYSDFGSVSKLPTSLIVLGLLLLAAAVSICAYLVRDRVRVRGAGA